MNYTTKFKVGDRVICLDVDGFPDFQKRLFKNRGVVEEIMISPSVTYVNVKFDDGPLVSGMLDTRYRKTNNGFIKALRKFKELNL
jgi:hypothetical protein